MTGLSVYHQQEFLTMKKKAVAAGHICIDITPVFPENTEKVRNPGDILISGKLIQMSAPDVHTGGAVANTGLGMKIMGADVRLLGKIGDDAFGGMIKGILDQYGAGDGLVVSRGETTSYSVVLAIPGVDRIFLHCPGANDSFTKDDIPEKDLEDAALFHFGYPTIMKRMYENDGSELVQLFQRIKEMGIATSLDLSAVDPLSESGKADWGKILSGVLPYVDFFVPSFEELCYMLERNRYEELIEKAGPEDITGLADFEADILPLAKKCLSMGANAVLLKCGYSGMLLLTSGHMEAAGKRLGLDAARWNSVCIFEKSYKIDQLRSATGAGDASIAALLTSILEGLGPEAAVQNAAAEGALCCTQYDAVSGLLPLKDVMDMIKRGWEKV